MEAGLTPSVSASVVTFHPDLPTLRRTLGSLREAFDYAHDQGRLGSASIAVVDNGCQPADARELADIASRFEAELISGHGNVGYGRGHNLSLLASRADYHLVLNPDLFVDVTALDEALRFMASNDQVVILAPDVRGSQGERQFLCKRYPSVLDLALRGFAPAWVKRRFDARLAFYEMRDLPRDAATIGVPLLSGSFMLCRRAPVASLGGFSDEFFVYFEDFDLSLRAAHVGALAYVPSVKAAHMGGYAAAKGWRHIFLFTYGAFRFFSRHGWRWT